MYWGAGHSVIVATSRFGFSSSRRVNVPLYRSLVFAPRNSRLFPEMTSEHSPSALAPTSFPFHVPWSASESDLCSVEAPDAPSTTAIVTKLRIPAIRFIQSPFVLSLFCLYSRSASEASGRLSHRHRSRLKAKQTKNER